MLCLTIFAQSPSNCEGVPDAHLAANGTISQPSRRGEVDATFNASGTAKIDQKCAFLWLAVEIDNSIWPRREGPLNIDRNEKWSEVVFEQGHPNQFGLSLWAANFTANIKLRGYLDSGVVTFSPSELQGLGMKRLHLVPELHIAKKQ